MQQEISKLQCSSELTHPIKQSKIPKFGIQALPIKYPKGTHSVTGIEFEISTLFLLVSRTNSTPQRRIAKEQNIREKVTTDIIRQIIEKSTTKKKKHKLKGHFPPFGKRSFTSKLNPFLVVAPTKTKSVFAY